MKTRITNKADGEICPARPGGFVRLLPRVRSRLLLPLALLWLGLAAQAAAPAVRSEYEVKAAFLHKFAMYVNWPETALPSAPTPFIIGILGQDPFGPHLENVLSNKTVRGHRIEFRRFITAEGAIQSGCHLLFIAPSEKDRLSGVLEAVKRSPMLTVGDSSDYGEKGVMINLHIQSATMRFEVNLHPAQQSGLKISSQLIDLASKVRAPSKSSPR